MQAFQDAFAAFAFEYGQVMLKRDGNLNQVSDTMIYDAFKASATAQAHLDYFPAQMHHYFCRQNWINAVLSDDSSQFCARRQKKKVQQVSTIREKVQIRPDIEPVCTWCAQWLQTVDPTERTWKNLTSAHEAARQRAMQQADATQTVLGPEFTHDMAALKTSFSVTLHMLLRWPDKAAVPPNIPIVSCDAESQLHLPNDCESTEGCAGFLSDENEGSASRGSWTSTDLVLDEGWHVEECAAQPPADGSAAASPPPPAAGTADAAVVPAPPPPNAPPPPPSPSPPPAACAAQGNAADGSAAASPPPPAAGTGDAAVVPAPAPPAASAAQGNAADGSAAASLPATAAGTGDAAVVPARGGGGGQGGSDAQGSAAAVAAAPSDAASGFSPKPQIMVGWFVWGSDRGAGRGRGSRAATTTVGGRRGRRRPGSDISSFEQQQPQVQRFEPLLAYRGAHAVLGGDPCAPR